MRTIVCSVVHQVSTLCASVPGKVVAEIYITNEQQFISGTEMWSKRHSTVFLYCDDWRSQGLFGKTMVRTPG